MKVAYVFSTANAHTILSNMIVPQLENDAHVAQVAGMFFFFDNTFLLQKGNHIGGRLNKISSETGMLLMACDQCCYEREIAQDLVENATIGCFPDLYKALAPAGVDQVITL